jgi:hypothetical protein
MPSKVDALLRAIGWAMCPWRSQRSIIETLTSSDRSHWMVAKTDLSPLRALSAATATEDPSTRAYGCTVKYA